MSAPPRAVPSPDFRPAAMRFHLLLLVVLAALPAAAQPAVTTGAQRLVDADFAALDGLRVGLVTNHTARVDTADGGPAHLIDRLAADGERAAVEFEVEGLVVDESLELHNRFSFAVSRFSLSRGTSGPCRTRA